MKDAGFFHELSHNFGLGKLIRFTPVPGGLLHRMFALDTDAGRFAVKILNPEILRRPEARDNFRKAERLEAQLSRHGIAICAALTINGQKMQHYAQQDFYIFPYLEGKPLYPGSLDTQHCEEMGALCAQLHAVDFRPDGFCAQPYRFDWQELCTRASCENPALGQLLVPQCAFLEALTKRAQEAARQLPAHSAVCHGDLDCKNVLWENGTPQLIDLECLCRSSPWLELMESALCFSGYDQLRLSPSCLYAYLRAYSMQLKPGEALDWACIFDARTDRLAWLEYNARRALGDENADDAAKAQGISQAEQTLALLRYQESVRADVLRTFSSVFA